MGIFLGLFGCCLITEKCLGLMGWSNGGQTNFVCVCFRGGTIRVLEKIWIDSFEVINADPRGGLGPKVSAILMEEQNL